MCAGGRAMPYINVQNGKITILLYSQFINYELAIRICVCECVHTINLEPVNADSTCKCINA